MDLPAQQPECGIALYRSAVTIDRAMDLSYEASADEFCRIYLDGKIIARGPERGLKQYWFKITGKLHLEPGEHTLIAEVFVFGQKLTAYAQESVHGGFYWQDDRKIFNNWQCKTLENISFAEPFPDWGAYPKVRVNKAFIPAASGGGENPCREVKFFEDQRILHERMLPEMRFERYDAWQFADGMVKFDHYVCAYGDYEFTGQGTVKLRWSESPYETDEYNYFSYTGNKGKRDGKFFVGNWDEFEIDGSLHWQDFHFKAGRFLEIVTTGSVKISRMDFYRTGYPWKFKKLPEFNSEKIQRFGEMVLRSIENCSWETFMDCPFYHGVIELYADR